MTTQIGYGPPWRIDGPPPIPPMYGLLAAAEAPAAGVRIVPDTDERGIERWINGVSVYPYPVDHGDVYDSCATGSDHVDKAFGAAVTNPGFGAFTAYLPITCTSYKVWDNDEFKARAVTALAAVESSIVAKEFLTGNRLPLNPNLSDGNGTFPVNDLVVSVPKGLALLEREIARTGRLGLIHCSPQTVSSFREHFAVDSKTGVIRTINGIVVIPDFGYTDGGTPPPHALPANADQEWLYASGPVDIRRSEIFTVPDDVSQAVERGTGGASTGRPNSYTYRAERFYLIDWDQVLQAAVLVDRTL